MFPGIPGSECALVATEGGSESKLFLDSPFPIEIQKINGPVYLADFDQYRDKVAVLDSKSLLSIFGTWVYNLFADFSIFKNFESVSRFFRYFLDFFRIF